MAYCAIADVQALNPLRGTYAAGTRPTDAQVTLLIDQIAGEIDTVLSARGIATPATAPASFLAFLKGLNARGAAALTEMGKFPEADVGPASTPHGQALWRIYQDGLKSLKDGSAIDPATAGSASSVYAETYQTANPDNDPYEDGTGDGQQPAFSMSRDLREF
jgi:hypothetical protein